MAEPRDPESVRSAARQILDRPEFDNAASTYDRFLYYLTHPLTALSDAFDWVLGRLPWSDTGLVVFSWLIVVIVAVAAIAAVVLLTRSTSSEAGTRAFFGRPPSGVSVDELLARAVEAETNGDLRLAVRWRYAALLVRLVDAGLLKQRSGRTGREYLVELSANLPAARPAFDRATSLFEIAWYGTHPVDRGQLDDFHRAYDQVVEAMP